MVPFAACSKIFDIYLKCGHIEDRRYDEHTVARRAVARGEHLFNTLRISHCRRDWLERCPSRGDHQRLLRHKPRFAE